MSMESQMIREIEILEDQYNNGAITRAEFQEACREIEREFEEMTKIKKGL